MTTTEIAPSAVDSDVLRRLIEPELERWKVPGIEVALVRDDEVVFAGGFGHADRDSKAPVTDQTLFHHGSTGKTHTALLVGILVEEGLLDWDEPIRTYLPDFKLSDPVRTELVTMRDLLSHRTGVSRNELMWVANPSWSRAELVRRLRFLDMARPFRTEFLYWNQGYALAGHIIGVVTGSTWEEQLRTRVLGPLGMTSATTSIPEAEATGNLSHPYAHKDGEVVEVNHRPIDPAAPAGQLMYNATDSARWLRFQANNGELDGVRLVNEDTYKQTRTVTLPVDVPSPIPDIAEWGPRFLGLGLGPIVGIYRDKPMVYAVGGIDGFATSLVVLPEPRIGVLIAANVSGSGLPFPLTFDLADRLLGVEPRPWMNKFHAESEKMLAAAKESKAEPKTVAGTSPSHALDEYVGDYEHPGYDALRVQKTSDTELGFTIGELDLTATYRHYDTWTARFEAFEMSFPLTFVTDADGVVAEIVAPLEPLVAPVRFARRADEQLKDPEFLSRLTGRYTLGEIAVEITLNASGTLVAEVAGQGSMELVPAQGTTFGLAAMPSQQVEFTVGAEGPATELSTQGMTFKRVSD
jgi:CubicO group peptidase (beta-lactamase class C family)